MYALISYPSILFSNTLRNYHCTFNNFRPMALAHNLLVSLLDKLGFPIYKNSFTTLSARLINVLIFI